jgi:hypothetical protein
VDPDRCEPVTRMGLARNMTIRLHDDRSDPFHHGLSA